MRLLSLLLLLGGVAMADDNRPVDLRVRALTGLRLTDPDNQPAQQQQQQQPLPQVYDPPPSEERQPDPRRWSATDLALQGLFAGLSATDVLQTLSFLPDREHYYERNPLLGKHPSPAKVVGAGLLGQAAHAAVAHYLPQPWRRLWQLGWIGSEAAVVGGNHRDGVRINLGRVF